MNIKNKFLLGAVSGLLMSVSSGALAQTNEIIYKIHDIEPVEENDVVTACEFGVTLFNRSAETVSDVKLDFGWKDEVISDTIKNEKKSSTSQSDGRGRGSKTEEFTSDTVTASVTVPPLAPSKQISLKSRVNTDRCFLLMGEVQTIVKSCKIGGSSKDKKAGVCSDMFKYVSPQNPEYYSDFAEISYDSRKAEEEKQNTKDMEELNKAYQETVNSLRKVSKTLESIKSSLPKPDNNLSAEDFDTEEMDAVVE